MWEILTRELFDSWFDQQNEETQIEILATLMILQEDGPNLGRPQVDTLKGSKFSNMKELRIQACGHPIRACFVFDPTRKGIILCAGDKKGQNKTRFYKKLIKIADEEYTAYLFEQEEQYGNIK